MNNNLTIDKLVAYRVFIKLVSFNTLCIPLRVFFCSKFAFICFYVSFFYFFPLHIINYCSASLCICVCAFVTLNKRLLTYLLTYLLTHLLTYS